LTSVPNGKTTIYKTGEYFYEPGNMTHAAYNKTSSPLVVFTFDILPADWKGRTVLPPKSQLKKEPLSRLRRSTLTFRFTPIAKSGRLGDALYIGGATFMTLQRRDY
jgi:hypothetical protein